MAWFRKVMSKVRYRVTHTSKFPKGDLTSFLLNVAERDFRPAHIVDVGANRAKWSEKALAVFPDCQFTLLEPQIEMKPHLERFCQASPGSTWITAGVGEELGELAMTIHPDTVSTTFTRSSDSAEASGLQQRVVPIITLDHLVENVIEVVPEMVKIDAEGFECKVMRGGQSLIGKTEVFLLEAPLIDPPENWASFAEIVAMMADYGYVPYDFTTFQKRPHDGAVGLCEIAFARRDGFLRSFRGWAKAA